jgi:hypothetical protein
VQKLFSEVAPKFADRKGGYTRIIKTAKHRIGDGGSIVVLELAHEATPPKGTVRRSAGLRRKRNERKHQFATKLRKGEKSTAEATTQPAAEKAAE